MSCTSKYVGLTDDWNLKNSALELYSDGWYTIDLITFSFFDTNITHSFSNFYLESRP